MDTGWFRAGTRKERPCFAAECGPDPFEHTRALEGPFFPPGLGGRGLGFILISNLRKPCFQLLNLLVNGCNYAYNYHLPRKD